MKKTIYIRPELGLVDLELETAVLVRLSDVQVDEYVHNPNGVNEDNEYTINFDN